MISIKYLYVIIPVLVLLIGITFIIMPMSKKKGIKNTNTLFIPSKVTNRQEGKLAAKESKKMSKLAKKRARDAKKKAERAAKKKAKADKKKAKKNKRRHKTE